MTGDPNTAAQRDTAPGATVVLEVGPMTRESSPVWAWLCVGVAAVLPYLNTLLGGFVFDDHQLVVSNPMATPGMAAWEWLLRPSTPGSLYRPVTMMTYAADWALGGTTLGFHLTNVCLHLAASLAAFSLARLLLPSIRYAVIAAVLFAVHPVHTEAVANLAGRAELLAGAFQFLALVALLRALEGQHRVWWVTAMGGTALLGMLSKESALAVPLLAGVVLWWRRDTIARREVAMSASVLFAACAVYVVARYLVVGTLGLQVPPQFVDNPLAHVPLLSRLATALVIVTDYLGVLTVPMRLSADDTFDQVPVVTSLGDVRLIVAFAVLLLIVAASFRARRTLPAGWYGLLFGLAALAVTANVAFPIGTMKAERFLYVPSLGWCLACAGLAAAAPLVTSTRVLALVVLLFATRTWMRNDDWRDDYRLFTATAITSPNSVRAQSNAGAVHAQRSEFERALYHYDTAVRIYPGFVGAQLGRGRLLLMQGRHGEALEAFDVARRSTPPTIEAYLLAGDLRLDTGEPAAAEQTYRDGLAVLPANPELLLGLAIAKARVGEREEALAIRDTVQRGGMAGIRSVPQRLELLATALSQTP